MAETPPASAAVQALLHEFERAVARAIAQLRPQSLPPLSEQDLLDVYDAANDFTLTGGNNLRAAAVIIAFLGGGDPMEGAQRIINASDNYFIDPQIQDAVLAKFSRNAVDSVAHSFRPRRPNPTMFVPPCTPPFQMDANPPTPVDVQANHELERAETPPAPVDVQANHELELAETLLELAETPPATVDDQALLHDFERAVARAFAQLRSPSLHPPSLQDAPDVCAAVPADHELELAETPLELAETPLELAETPPTPVDVQAQHEFERAETPLELAANPPAPVDVQASLHEFEWAETLFELDANPPAPVDDQAPLHEFEWAVSSAIVRLRHPSLPPPSLQDLLDVSTAANDFMLTGGNNPGAAAVIIAFLGGGDPMEGARRIIDAINTNVHFFARLAVPLPSHP